MSNKTTFKRIALAMVAALGFGVLSVAPSSAAIVGLTVTAANGAAVNDAGDADSTTAITFTIAYTKTSNADTVVVSAFLKSRPTTAAALGADDLKLMATDSSTSTVDVKFHRGATASNITFGDSATASSSDTFTVVAGGATGAISLKVGAFIETTAALSVGNYVISLIATPYEAGNAKTPVVTDGTIVVNRSTSNSTTVDSSKTVAVLAAGASGYTTDTLVTTADAVVSAAAAASSTAAASFIVKTFNASYGAVDESVTVTISGAGTACIVGVSTNTCGSSLITSTGTDGEQLFTILPNGIAGVATIKVATTTKTFADKTVTFYATDPATYTPSLEKPVIGIGATTGVVDIEAKDANGNIWGGPLLYLYSSDTSVATATSCAWVAADEVHRCTVTGVKAGETKWTIGNKDTLALSTVKSAEFAGPRVTAATAATVKVEFDKAAYAPGEKARIYVTPLDAAGLTLPGGSTLSSLFAEGGIASSVAFSSGSETLTAVDLPISASNSAVTGAKAGSAMYTVYMPFGKGTVTLTAKGGTGLPLAGRVAVTASADVVDDSVDAAVDAAQEATDAAIAATDAAILAQEAADEAASAAIAAQETAQAAVDAVTALSAEVTKLVAQLATVQKLVRRVAKKVGVKL